MIASRFTDFGWSFIPDSVKGVSAHILDPLVLEKFAHPIYGIPNHIYGGTLRSPGWAYWYVDDTTCVGNPAITSDQGSNGVLGRYVRVSNPQVAVIHLSELSVFSNGINVAKGRPVSVSSLSNVQPIIETAVQSPAFLTGSIYPVPAVMNPVPAMDPPMNPVPVMDPPMNPVPVMYPPMNPVPAMDPPLKPIPVMYPPNPIPVMYPPMNPVPTMNPLVDELIQTHLQTSGNEVPWVMIDLGNLYNVDNIRILNNRSIAGSQVSILDSAQQIVWQSDAILDARDLAMATGSMLGSKDFMMYEMYPPSTKIIYS